MIVPGLIMFLIGGVMVGVYFAIIALSTSTTTETIDNGYGGTYSYNVQTSSLGAGGLLLGIVLYVVVFVAIMYLSASMITGALRVADGQPVSVATFLKPDRFGPVVGTAIVVGLITAVGLVLCIIPGLIAIFLLQFSIFFVIDKKLGLGAAMSASTNLSRSSVSNSLLTLVVATCSPTSAPSSATSADRDVAARAAVLRALLPPADRRLCRAGAGVGESPSQHRPLR